jgi:hypothetical protein
MPHPQHRQRALVAALLVSLLLWYLPSGGLVLYPFKLLATWMHELCHGVVMTLSGVGFERMDIYRDTSGLAFASGGANALGSAAIAAAGYMGTPLLGALILIAGQTRRGARAALTGLGAAMAVTSLFYISNDFGIAVVIGGAGLCAVGAMFASERLATVVVAFIAAQACINAVLDVRVLFRPEMVVNGEVMGASDAHAMAAATGGTPWMWAVIWLVWAFAVLFGALRWVHVHHRRTADAMPGAA